MAQRRAKPIDCNEAAERLKTQSHEILREWEACVRREVPAAESQNSVVLRDSVPELLERLTEALSNGTEPDTPTDATASREHGDQRAGLPKYTLEQVILEYHLLRRTLLNALEAEAPLNRNASDLLHKGIDFAIRSSAAEYSRRLLELHRESVGLQQTIFDNTPALIFIKDLEGRRLLVNRQYREFFRQSEEELLGKTDFDLFPDEIAERLRANDQEVIRNGEAVEKEEVIPFGEELRTFNSLKFPLRDPNGVLFGLCGIATDISEQKDIEQEKQRLLQETEAARALAEDVWKKFLYILDSISEAFFTLDREWRVTYYNRSAESLIPRLHLAEESVVGRSFWSLLPDLRGRSVEAEFQRAMEERDPVQLEGYYPPLDSWYFVRAYPTSDGLSVFLTDITARKKAEEEARNRAHQQAVVAELGQRALVGGELQEFLDEAARRMAETLDVEYSAILELLPNGTEMLLRAGSGWQEGLVGHLLADADTELQAGYTLFSTEPVIVEDLSSEERFKGHTLALQVGVVSGISVAIPGPKGPWGVMGALSPQKRKFTEDDIHFFQAMANVLASAIERKQAEEAMRLHSRLLESMREGVSLTDESGVIVYTNPAEDRIFGYEPGELTGQHVTVQNAYPAEENHRIVSEIMDQLKEQGAWYGEFDNVRKDGTPFTTYARIIALEMAGKHYWLCVQEDITERKRSEEEIHRIMAHARCILWSSEIEEREGSVYWNSVVPHVDAAQKVLPLEVSEDQDYAGAWYFARHPEDTRELDRKGNEAVLSGQPFYTQEYRCTNRYGQIQWLREEVTLQQTGPGRWRGVGVCIDITGLKMLEGALKKVISSARCLLWYGEVTQDDAGWLRWKTQFFDEEATEQKVPLDREPGESYSDAWYRSRFASDRDRTDHEANAAIRGGERFYSQEFRHRLKGGRMVWFYQTVSVEPLGPRHWNLVGVCIDITDRRQMEEALQFQAEELIEADRRKDEFLAMLAHELRNPLAPIQNAVQIMRLRGPDDELMQRSRDVVDRQVRHMARLIDDLLDVSRITQGKVGLKKEKVDLATVVAHAVQTARPLIDSRQHDLSVLLPMEPVELNADPTRLEEIIINLLTNAAKFTEPEGKIQVTTERTGSEAVIRVRDTGIGISEEMLPRVFKLFDQADRSLDRSQGGLGIGLTLVKRLTEMHGGTVRAFSEGLGQGSEFEVRLPALPAARRVSEPASVKATAQEGPSRTILVVDDNFDAAETLAGLLELWGHTVHTAHDGPSALAAAGECPPDIVLLDIGLPGMSGYEVAQKLREQKEFDGTLLIAVSGYGQEESLRQSESSAFDHHLTKPVDPETLQRLLNDNGDRA